MLKILVVGAHPDDPEGVAGLTIKWIKMGHKVKFLSLTDGQSGHHLYPGQKLVEIRKAEAEKVCQYLGLEGYDFLDIADGYLTADISSREKLMRVIREYAPDVIITHRPFDYHPDHRATGQLVQDCSYLVRVPNFLPTVPVPDVMPAIFYMVDTYKIPLPFRGDYVFDMTDLEEEKLKIYAFHQSQFFEWLPWIGGVDMSSIPTCPQKRIEWLKGFREQRWLTFAETLRQPLIQKYGQEKGSQIKVCEGLEKCEYGGTHSQSLIDELFE